MSYYLVHIQSVKCFDKNKFLFFEIFCCGLMVLCYAVSMTEKCKCPECGGKKATSTWNPPYQEYAGASVQGGYSYIECPDCGLEDIVRGDLSNFNYRENRRGW